MADAVEVGQIKYTLDLDDAKYKQGLADADKQADSFASKSQQYFDQSTKASQQFAVGLFAVGTALVATAGYGVKLAGDLEAARAGFITLLGSAQKADAAISMIQKDAASTPFTFPGLLSANQLLTSVTKNADQSETLLLNVGKALTAMGKGQPELDRIIVNLQQIGATGHATLMDVRQFAFAGIPIFEMLSKATGKTGQALADMISNGGVTFELLTKMFNDAGMAGGRFADSFKNQAGGFNQLVSNMSDTFNMFLVGLVKSTGVFDAVKQGIAQITNFMSAHQKEIQAGIISAFQWIKENGVVLSGIIIGALVPAFIALAGSIGSVIVTLAPWALAGAAIALVIQKLGINLNDVTGAFKMLFDVVTGGDPTVAKGQERLIGFAKVLSYVRDMVLTVWDTLNKLGVIKAFQDAFRELANVVMTQLWPALKELWTLISPTLLPALKILGALIVANIVVTLYILIKAITLVAQALTYVVGKINEFIQNGIALYNFFVQLPGQISAAFTLVSQAVSAGLAAVGAVIQSGLNTIGGFFTEIWNRLVFIFNNFPEVIGLAFGLGVRVFHDSMAAIAVAIIDGFTNAFNWATQAVTTFLTNTQNFFTALPGNISIALANLWATVTSWFTRTGNDIQNSTTSALNAIVGFFSTLPGRILAFAGGVANAALGLGVSFYNGFRDGIASLPNLMGNILNSMGKMLTDAANSLYNSMKNVAANIWKGFKEGLGIHSPSYIEEAMSRIAAQSKDTIQSVGADMKGLANIIPISSPLAMAKTSNPVMPTTVVQNNTIFNQVDYDAGISQLGMMLDARR